MSGWVMSEEMSELDMIRQVASDRLIFMRLLEKAVNDIDGILSSLKRDIMEVSNQVASRNSEMTMVQEDETDEPAEE